MLLLSWPSLAASHPVAAADRGFDSSSPGVPHLPIALTRGLLHEVDGFFLHISLPFVSHRINHIMLNFTTSLCFPPLVHKLLKTGWLTLITSVCMVSWISLAFIKCWVGWKQWFLLTMTSNYPWILCVFESSFREFLFRRWDIGQTAVWLLICAISEDSSTLHSWWSSLVMLPCHSQGHWCSVDGHIWSRPWYGPLLRLYVTLCWQHVGAWPASLTQWLVSAARVSEGL